MGGKAKPKKHTAAELAAKAKAATESVGGGKAGIAATMLGKTPTQVKTNTGGKNGGIFDFFNYLKIYLCL